LYELGGFIGKSSVLQGVEVGGQLHTRHLRVQIVSS